MNSLAVMILIGVVILSSIIFSQGVRAYDGKLHIVFCDVGQGDAIFLRTPSRQDILIDGGPDQKVLTCLDDQLPFWDRTLTAVLLTHPHYDHFRGLIDVLDRYTVLLVGQENLQHNSEAYEVFTLLVEKEGSKMKTMQRGTQLTFPDGVVITILGPDSAFLDQENPDGFTGSDNPPSLILHVTYGNFDLLHSGDSDGQDLVTFLPARFQPDVFTLAHHGSEHGYTQAASQILSSQIGVISAGKDNSYGHPHPSVLQLLKQKRTKILRTDDQGTIHMIVDRNGTITVETER